VTGVDNIAPIDQALLPAAVRDGTPQRKQDYQAAVAFEQVLLGQLTKQMSSSLETTDSSGTDTTPAAVKAEAQLLPDAMAQALSSAGGIGVAAQIDAAWHPTTPKART